MGAVDNVLGTNIFGDNSQDRAIAAQTNAANQSNETQRYIFDTQRADYQPWRDAGMRALSGLEDKNLLGDFQGDPGYQFRLAEGNKAINNAAAARGMGNSGRTLKELSRYGQDYASNEYGNAYNRAFSRLSTLAGFGSGANQGMANAAQNYGNAVSGNQIGLGNSIASANIATANRQAQLAGQGTTALAFSDERLKTNLEPVSKEDLLEMKKHLKAYAFNYISDEFGKGDWIGIMAQDLEKSKLGKTLVVENDKGQKLIDLKKVLSMFLATMAEA